MIKSFLAKFSVSRYMIEVTASMLALGFEVLKTKNN
jgi:hypothetical protein